MFNISHWLSMIHFRIMLKISSHILLTLHDSVFSSWLITHHDRPRASWLKQIEHDKLTWCVVVITDAYVGAGQVIIKTHSISAWRGITVWRRKYPAIWIFISIKTLTCISPYPVNTSTAIKADISLAVICKQPIKHTCNSPQNIYLAKIHNNYITWQHCYRYMENRI